MKLITPYTLDVILDKLFRPKVGGVIPYVLGIIRGIYFHKFHHILKIHRNLKMVFYKLSYNL